MGSSLKCRSYFSRMYSPSLRLADRPDTLASVPAACARQPLATQDDPMHAFYTATRFFEACNRPAARAMREIGCS